MMKMMRRKLVRTWLVVGCLGLLLSTLSAQQTNPPTRRIPDGKGEVSVSLASNTIKVFTYRPKNYSATRGPLVVVFHGHSRNPDKYRDHAMELGNKCAGLVVAPFFDEKQFPGQTYNHGKLFVDGVLQPREKWTFSLVPQLIQRIRTMEGRS
jgi:poly(3-hydroxybutyrate) depolymerase